MGLTASRNSSVINRETSTGYHLRVTSANPKACVIVGPLRHQHQASQAQTERYGQTYHDPTFH